MSPSTDDERVCPSVLSVSVHATGRNVHSSCSPSSWYHHDNAEMLGRHFFSTLFHNHTMSIGKVPENPWQGPGGGGAIECNLRR